MTDQYPHLFSPLRIGPVESRNRVVLGAHFTQFSEPSPVWGEPGFAGQPGSGVGGGPAVPEPSKLVAMFGLASMGLIGLAWRRRKQAA